MALHPFYPDGFESTRWMPQPCPFLNEEKTACTVHKIRPVVCSIHPIIFTDDMSAITIKANCAYGRDMIKQAYKKAKEMNPGLEIPL
jgi:Fe-S-cluster containining protein